MSSFWIIPASPFRQGFILKFLREEQRRLRAVELQLFRADSSRDQRIVGSRQWQPLDDLVSTAKEIPKYAFENRGCNNRYPRRDLAHGRRAVRPGSFG
jgi:hypothetical protein